jgi:sigma-B regulation protein RsbU (phosphoserine phosphatase)
MLRKSRVLIIHPDSIMPESLGEALEDMDMESSVCRPENALEEISKGKDLDAVVLAYQKLADLDKEIGTDVLQKLRRLSVNTLILADRAERNRSTNPELQEGLFWIGPNESAEMIKGRLSTLIDMKPILDQMSMELNAVRMTTQPLNNYFSQVDEEMRLASRLQKDFLPKELPQLPGIRFSTVYRPATWVSGDIYDIMRLDEDHVGFYIADAVGHGMPAALLTMYIKRALVTKRITGHKYTIIEPGVALGRLNDDMVAQNLSNFQFATCCYGILNIKTLSLRVANAGHPMPMHIDKDSQNHELNVTGSLLGVFEQQEYETKVFQLNPHEKLLLYSDGVELAFVNEGPDKPLRFRKEFGDLSHYDMKKMCDKLVEIINKEEGSLHPRDDLTIVGLEIFPTS